VSLFGLTALAPVYMGVLDALARHIAVHVFYLDLCREYWTDLVDERGQARRRARVQRAGLPDPTGMLDVGSPLLASLGLTGQVFLDQLLECGGMRIPWSIADRCAGAEHPLLEAFDRLLALPRCRFEVTETLTLLEVPALQRRFGLDAAGLERVRTWVRESGIRWGQDAARRADLGLPAEQANTWALGLDRLFVGL